MRIVRIRNHCPQVAWWLSLQFLQSDIVVLGDQFRSNTCFLIDHLHLAFDYVEYADHLLTLAVDCPIVRVLFELAFCVDLELVCQVKPAHYRHGQSDDSPKYLIHFGVYSEQPCSLGQLSLVADTVIRLNRKTWPITVNAFLRDVDVVAVIKLLGVDFVDIEGQYLFGVAVF